MIEMFIGRALPIVFFVFYHPLELICPKWFLGLKHPGLLRQAGNLKCLWQLEFFFCYGVDLSGSQFICMNQ